VAGLAVAGANFDVMSDESRIERRLDRLIEHAVNPRKAAVVIATVTTVTFTRGVADDNRRPHGIPTLGSGGGGQTVTTVGYGDHVPDTTRPDRGGGRDAARISSLTVITASITGAFVAVAPGRTSEPRPAAAGIYLRSSSASSASRPRRLPALEGVWRRRAAAASSRPR
jgi:hypothetical protein